MIEGIIFLASYGAFEGGFDSLFNQWESFGVFSYLLPFLLIFALIFGILSKLKLFGENSKKISAIIALAVGLIALRTPMVSVFFADIFPRLGIALAAILVFVIVLGIFGNPKNRALMNTLMWGSFGVGVIVVLQSTEIFGGGIRNLFEYIPTWVITAIIFIVVVAVVVGSSKKPEDQKTNIDDIPYVKALIGK